LTYEARKRTLGILEVPLVLASLAISLALAAAGSDPAPAVTPPSKPKLICRESEAELGSHIHRGRRCKTAEEWALEDANKEQIPATMRVTTSPGDGVPHPQRPQ
jgi:hypothetical protein